jgi:hypothetical protein
MPSGKQSERLPATGIVFRETTADYENSWHRAPRRQYVISLAGGISITASDGETRHIGAGEIVLVEDTTGKGHITKSSGADRATRSSCRSIDRAAADISRFAVVVSLVTRAPSLWPRMVGDS